MTNDTELQRLMRLRRLVRKIATSLQADLDRERWPARLVQQEAEISASIDSH